MARAWLCCVGMTLAGVSEGGRVDPVVTTVAAPVEHRLLVVAPGESRNPAGRGAAKARP